jgi:cell wall-associated NlpC family hydrolase
MKSAAKPQTVGPFSQGRLVRGLTLCTTLALSLALVACASRTKPPAKPLSASAAAAYNPVRNDLVLVAMGLLDTRYTSGGRGPATGFDCSGLVAHVYKEGAGIPVKGSAADLGRQSRPIDPAQLLPGDLVFFNTLGSRHSHVGVYVGEGRFVHASNPRTGVRMDSLSNRYYAQRFEGAQSMLD